MKDIKFRKAEPEDVREAIPLILLSGPTSFAYVFENGKKNATDYLNFAFPRLGGEFSYDNHYVLEKQKRVIATGAIYSHQKSKEFTKHDFLNILNVYRYSSIGVLQRGLKTEGVLAMPRRGEYYIGHIAVDAFERGHGFGELMMSEIMNTLILNEEESFILDVDVDNFKAQRLYKKLGFQKDKLMQSKLKSKFGHVPDHYRLFKKGK